MVDTLDILRYLNRVGKKVKIVKNPIFVIIVVVSLSSLSIFSALDLDDDSLSNYREMKIGTSMMREDTSGDGLSDDEALDYWLDPQKRYPARFVSSLKPTKKIYPELSKRLTMTLLDDDELSETEDEYLDEFDEMRKRDIDSFHRVNRAILIDLDLSDHELYFVQHLNNLTGEFSSMEDQIVEYYTEDEMITEREAEHLKYLDTHLGIKSSFLTGDGRLGKEEFEYIARLSDSKERLTQQILRYRYHRDGMISWEDSMMSKDSDSDGLITNVEVELGTDPHEADTDGDGIIDGDEHFVHDTDPLNADSDDDGVIDGAELSRYETDPTVPDTDGDGLLDGEEIFDFWSDPTADNPSLFGIKQDLEEEGGLSPNELWYLKWFSKDFHNISTQMLECSLHEDGNITDEDVRNVSDKDGDGLIRYMELEIGTDPEDPDTDNDYLYDGWEVYGFQRKDKKPVPLSDYGADPLHKDIFVELIGDEHMSKSEKDRIVEVFSNAPVSNPDGEEGINLHLDDDTEGYSLGGENLDIDSYHYNDIGTEYHRYGIFHFGRIHHMEKYMGLSAVNGYNFEIDKDYIDDPRYLSHELGHNIIGKLDPENQYSDEDKIHGRYRDFAMYPSPGNITYHPEVWDEIERDGLIGLPSSKEFGDWTEVEWEISY